MSTIAMTCIVCNTKFKASRSTHKTCSDRCRQQLHRNNQSSLLDDAGMEISNHASVAHALQTWFEQLDGVQFPPPLVAQARMLASKLDLKPGDASLHARFTSVVKMLSDSVKQDEQTIDDAIDELYGDVNG